MDLNFYKIMFDSLEDGILLVDANCIVVDCNDAYLKMVGSKREDIIGTDHNAYIRQTHDREAHLKTVMQIGKPIIDVDDSVMKDNKNTNRFVSVYPLRKDGTIVGAVSIFKNLKMVNRSIAEYRKNAERMENSIRNAHVAHFTFDDILGDSPGFIKIKETAKKMASSEYNILILGENGTGKELFAQAIHNESNRQNQPFVAVNCPSLFESLAESELFGYEEGAFSGAVRGGRIGLCEIADRGTLFLDEIGDLSLNIQAKILRLLESGEFLRVGGTKPVKVQLRVIAATNRDLIKMMEKNLFRQDLYYRLYGLGLTIPPLRSHPEDIPRLVEFFMGKNGQKHIMPNALKTLVEYSWPGNVRELRNIVRSLIFLSEGDTISMAQIPERISNGLPWESIETADEDMPTIISGDKKLKNAWEEQQIKTRLDRYGRSYAAKRRIAMEMGISISTLYNKIRNYGL